MANPTPPQPQQQQQPPQQQPRRQSSASSGSPVGNPIEAIWSRILHIGILLYKNFLLSIRNWKTTVLRIVCPPLLIVVLFLVQLALRSTNNIHPTTLEIGGIPKNKFVEHSTLLYAPKSSSVVHSVMKDVAESNVPPLSIDNFNTPTNYSRSNPCAHDVCGFDDEEQIFWYLANMTGIAGAVEFQSPSYSYKIWYNQTTLRTTAWIPIDDPVQFFDFRLEIQKSVDRSLMRHFSGNNDIDLTVRMKPLPDLANSQANPEGLVEACGVFVWFIAVFISTLTVHHSITYEREHKLREGMKMMGMHDVSYWASWLIYHAVIEALAMALLVVTGYVIGLSMFRNCNPLIMFVVLYGMALSISTLWLMLSTIVRNERSTNITAFIVLLLSLPWLAMWSNWGQPTVFGLKLIGYYVVEFEGLMWLVINPVFTFGKLMSDITLNTRLEFSSTSDSWVSGPGFGFDDLWTRLFDDNNAVRPLFANVPVPLVSLGFLLLSGLINIVVLWFLDNTVPTEYGLPRPPWFFFLPSYWGIHLKRGQLNIDLPSNKSGRRLQEVLFDMDEDIFQEYEYVLNSVHQHDENVPVKIVKLSKTYGGRLLTRGLNNSNNTRALDSLCLSVNKGTVLALLGHNGAGKTTAINILTGLYGPSNGDALIYGHGVVNEIDDIRSIMGVCPQHDILWDELTAKEHMLMFALFKRVPWKEIGSVVEKHLAEVNLLKVQNRRSKTYSGGMKRRLSVAISFLGSPKIVFLDEPTSGMDPIHKRQVWDLITQKKSDRVVILTTHSMDEADMLGDKIAIMALGRLRAIGSSLHLKNRFGGGYTIRLVTEPQQSEVLKQKVVQMLPDIVLEVETAGSITYSLPRSSLGDSIALEAFFRFLEQESSKSKRLAEISRLQNIRHHLPGGMHQLDASSSSTQSEPCLIKDWSISHTTLTEVFMRLTHGDPRRFIKSPSSASTSNAMGLGSEGRGQLNVAWEGSVEALGFTEIGESTTLAGVRQIIISELLADMQPVPDFVFLSGGVAVTRMQESKKTASKYLPLVLLRRVDRPSHDVVPPGGESASLSIVPSDSGRARITELEALTAQLQSRLQEEQQRSQLLERRIAQLEALLAPPSSQQLPGNPTFPL